MNPLLSPEMKNRIRDAGIVAVLVIDDANHAVPLANCLYENGITAMELTLRTPAALPSLEKIRAQVPDMLAGVGTVLTSEQIDQAVQAGAAFGVAPGLNPTVLQKAKEADFPFAPGIATPSEIERAVELGCDVLKFFPAEPLGGMKYLKSAAGPYAHLDLTYIPLGGVSVDNMRSYLDSPLVLGLGGSWIAPRKLIADKDWKTIADNARKVADVVKEFR